MPAFYNVADDACDRHPADKLAMVWDDDRGTSRNVYWGELQDLSSRIANALSSLNVATGDRVVMVLSPEPGDGSGHTCRLALRRYTGDH